MVLTQSELVASLHNEVAILLHLAGKIAPPDVDYRPTAGQRSTIELLRYLTMMGPELIKAAKSGAFDPQAWTVAEQAAATLSLDQAVSALANQPIVYDALLADLSDSDLRAEIEMFGDRTSRGAFLVEQVLCGCAAYRMQLFLYLKSSGHSTLNTMNLWGGMDAEPTPA